MKKWLMMGASLTLAVTLAACGDGDGKETKKEAKKADIVLQTEEELVDLYQNPKAYKGAEVHFTGRAFSIEKDGDFTYMQVWENPEDVANNTIVKFDSSLAKVKEDDYVKVVGIVGKEFKGENMLGGEVKAPTVEADSVEIIPAVEAIAPTKETKEINETKTQHNVSIDVQKIEFADEQTRVYVKVRNDSQMTIDFYTFNTKLIEGSTQHEEETLFISDLPEMPSELLPGIEAEGMIVFPSVETKEGLKFQAKVSGDDYDLSFEPFVFELP